MERIDEYLQALASEAPTPGGGSAASLVAAHGAALVAMVARICASNPKRSDIHGLAQRLVIDADAATADLLEARLKDEVAFSAVVAAQALPRDTDVAKDLRSQALQASLAGAAKAPLHAATLALHVLHLTRDALDLNNRDLLSDLGCAAEFASAAVHAYAYNVRINHRYLRDTVLIAEQERDLAALESAQTTMLDHIRRVATAIN